MYNRCEFIGRVGKQPEVRTYQETKFVSFSLAVSEKYTNKSGEKVENTEWCNCTFNGKLADVVEKYVNKGDLVFVAGKYKSRTYDKDGQKHLAVEFICSELKMLGSKSENKTDDTQAAYQSPLQSSGLPPSEMAFTDGSKEPEDDLPF